MRSVMQLWNKGEYSLVVDTKDIEQRICFEGENIMLIRSIGFGEIRETPEELEAALNQYQHDNNIDGSMNELDDVADFFETLGYNVSVVLANDYQTPYDMVAFDVYNQKFGNLLDSETIPYHEYWDGSNWKVETLTQDDSTFDYEIDTDDYVCLDVTNSSTSERNCGGIGLHENVYRVVGKFDRYLIVKSSQWQGSHDTGAIVDYKGLLLYIDKELEQDLDEYEFSRLFVEWIGLDRVKFEADLR